MLTESKWFNFPQESSKLLHKIVSTLLCDVLNFCNHPHTFFFNLFIIVYFFTQKPYMALKKLGDRCCSKDFPRSEHYLRPKNCYEEMVTYVQIMIVYITYGGNLIEHPYHGEGCLCLAFFNLKYLHHMDTEYICVVVLT